MKFAFYISGKGTRLRNALKLAKFKELFGQTVIIISDSELNIDLRSQFELMGIHFLCFEYSNLKETAKERRLELSLILLREFQKFEVDYVFCFGDHILTGSLLEVFENKIINFHPSLLPHFRGRRAIDQAIASGNFLIGNTAHFITETLDDGPIIMQSVVTASLFDKYGYDGVLDQQLDMMYTIYHCLLNSKIKVVQGKVIIEGADYFKANIYPFLD